MGRGMKKRKYVLLSMSLLAGIGLLILGFFHSMIGVIFGVLLVAGCGGTQYRIILGYSQRYINTEERSSVISTMNMLKLMLNSILNLIIGYIVGLNLRIFFFVCGCSLILWTIVSPIREKHLIVKLGWKKKKKDVTEHLVEYALELYPWIHID